MQERNIIRFKVLVLGDSKVGKTSFLKAYTTGEFNKFYRKTHGSDFFSFHLKTTDTFDIDIHFWDISGRLDTEQSETYFKDSHGAIVIFDERNETILNVEKWRNLIREKISLDGKKYDPPSILVANKIDVICEKSQDYDRKPLNDMCEKLGFTAAYPCCTAAIWNVKPVVARLVKAMMINMQYRHVEGTFDENEEIWQFLDGPKEEPSKCILQ